MANNLMSDLRKQAVWQGLMNMGASLMANSGPTTTPTSPLQGLGAGLMGFNQGMEQGVDAGLKRYLLQGKLDALGQDQQARTAIGSLLGVPSGTAGMSPGGPGMPAPGPTVDAANRTAPTGVAPENMARARALYLAGDMAGAVKALFPDNKPIVRDFTVGDQIVTKQSFDGGRTWQDMEGVGGPRYKPTTTVNTTVDAGTKSPIGKLVSDRRALVELYGENHPGVKAIDQQIAKAAQSMTELQGKSTLQFHLADKANNELNEVDAILTNPGDFIASQFGTVGNYFKSPEYQKAEQSATVIAEMYLRAITGAAAPEQEVQRTRNSIVPRPGDGPEVIAQKRATREAIVNTLRTMAGPGAGDPKKALKDKYGLE